MINVFAINDLSFSTAFNTVFATLPLAYRPAMSHIYTSGVIVNGDQKATVTIQASTNGQVKVIGYTGTFDATGMISIATNFIVG